MNSNNNNNNNNQNVNRNVNHVDVIRNNSIMEIDSHTPINSIHNVTGVRKRGMLAKQIPSSSQPIVSLPVPLPSESSELEKEPVIETIQPNENLGNFSKVTSQNLPILHPIVDKPFERGMPHVPPNTSNGQNGSKFFNPIINGENFGYNPIEKIHNIPSNINPISLFNPPLGVVLPEPSQLIKVSQNLPQLIKQSMNPPIGSNINPLKGRKAHRSKPIGIMQDTIPYDLLADLGQLKVDIYIKRLLGVAPQCRSLL
jgi:hypothetical protein